MRIDRQDLAVTTRRLAQPIGQPLVEKPLAVIGDYDRIYSRHRTLDAAHRGRRLFLGHALLALAIERTTCWLRATTRVFTTVARAGSCCTPLVSIPHSSRSWSRRAPWASAPVSPIIATPAVNSRMLRATFAPPPG